MSKRSILILGAGTPWVDALAVALAERGWLVQATALYDFRTFAKARVPDRQDQHPNLIRRNWVFPPGYAGLLSVAFAPILQIRLNLSLRRLCRRTPLSEGDQPCVIAPYPWFKSALQRVPNNRLIYFNLDNYSLYRPTRAKRIGAQEAELIRRASLTLCLSHYQTETLRRRFPDSSANIRHFPLGVSESYLASSTQVNNNERAIGYVGNLSDRVDWRLVREVASALPEFSFVFVGQLDGTSSAGCRKEWQRERASALSLPNVKRLAWVPQAKVASYYRGFTINWIPYTTDHPFNLASCPTKIMDGLASGQPMISTDIPECRLYPGWIRIIHSTNEAVEEIRQRYFQQKESNYIIYARAQVEFARSNLWSKRAETLEKWLA